MKSSPKLLTIVNAKLLIALMATAVLALWFVFGIGKRSVQPSPSLSVSAGESAVAGNSPEFRLKKARGLFSAAATQSSRAISVGKDLGVKFPLSTIAIPPANSTQPEAAKSAEEFERTVAPGEEDEGEHGGREDWFYAQRAYPRPEIPFGAMVNANEELAREETALRLRSRNSLTLELAAPVWTPLGPAPIALGQTFGSPRVPVSGRINVLALDPGYNGGANQTVYIGAAVGGVWRTTNNGQTWTPLMDDQPFLAIGALAIDPTNPNVIYAGTGEGKATQGYYGVGMLKSTDGGASWNLITGPISTRPPNQPAFINASFNRIAIDPVTPSIVFATTTVGIPNSAASSVGELPPLGQRGVWRSADSGQTWTNVDPPGTGGNFSATDVLIDPANHNRIFAVMRGVGLYRSTNGGLAGSWTKLTSGIPPEAQWLRGMLAVGPPLAPSTESTVYLALATPSSDLQGIYRSTDGGNNWTALVRPQVRGQANYNLGLAVDPTDANVLYYGTSANESNNGGTLWRSLNGGQSWSDLSRGSGTGGLHADTHFIAVSPTNRNILFTANDGGIFRTANATGSSVTWTSLNPGLSLTQFQSLALHPTDANFIIGGTQDNGTNRFTGNTSWTQMEGGDGGFTVIDQSNPLVMYHTFFNQNAESGSALMGGRISFDGGNTWPTFVGCNGCNAAPGQINPNDEVSFYAPLVGHPGFTGAGGNVIYYGTTRVYRSANRGQTWTGLGPSNDGFGTNLTKGQPNTRAYLTAIAPHPQLNTAANPPGEVVWVGTADGNVQVTANAGALAGATWINLTKAPLPNRHVTDIALDPNNQQRAMVTFSGFNANTATTPGHVFLTTNGGGSWTDISGNLPDTPANSGVIDPGRANTYYIGTDIGVFQTTDGGATWIRMADGMPKVPVLMLRYHAASQNLVAATHGRGMYRAQIGTANPGQTTEELKTDDGTAETGTVSNGLIIVNRLTPSAYPSTLQKIRIFTGQFQNQPNPAGQLIRLIALNNATAPPAGSPLLLDQTVAIPSVQSAGFVEFTINNGPTITSGDWYIGFQAPNPANGVGFFADTNGAQQQRGYFSTNNGGTYQGPLVFTGTPQVPVNILIRAVVQNGGQINGPNIEVTPASLDFGSVNVNATLDRTLTVRNTGTAALNITGITSNNARFSVTSATSFTVAPGGQQIVTVRFAPTAAGVQTGTLTVASNDPAKPSVTVSLNGTGATQGGDLVTLTSGVAYNDTLPAPPAGLAVFNPVQYAIQVPSGATQLRIELNGNQDVDLYVRFGQRVSFGQNGVTADFASESFGGSETITITGASSPSLQPGNYLIAVINFGPGAASYSVKATVTVPQQCSYAISPTSQAFTASGGQGSVAVATASGCAWLATSNAGFVTINSGASGSGNGTVNFTVAANTATTSRTGTMTVAGQTFTVTQSGLSCSYSISPTSQSFTASGGQGSVSVTTIAGCSWTAVSNVGFATINSGTSGSGNGTVNFTVAANTATAQRSGTLTIAGQTFTVTQEAAQPINRVVRVVAASGSPSGTVAVPIELVSQGDENALGFSLTFDSSLLGSPQTALGGDAGGASLNTNVSQVGQGRLGIAVSLPTGQRFTAGTRQIVVVTFTIASTQAASTNLGFGDQPVAREVSNTMAGALPANYTGGAVTFTTSYEADVAPRPNGSGNGTVTVTDWVQVGRFVSGEDQASTGSEFQRADIAPKDTKGNGSLTITDWVQAGRYAAGLDLVVTAGGPTAPVSFNANERLPFRHVAAFGPRVLKVLSANLERGQRGTVTIEFDAQGNENALGFSLNFDPAQLQFISAVVGSGATGATLNVNSAQAAKGRLGLALALPAGQVFAAGLRQIVTLTFAASATGNATNSAISFGDSPVAREVSDAAANVLPTAFSSGAMALTRSVATVSAASFLRQTLAQEAIVSAFGGNLATTVVVANRLPLPTELAGTTVKVRDSAGIERFAPLFFVAPTQVNYQIPPGTAAGAATVTVISGDGSVSIGTATIGSVAPGVFAASANGQGPAAAVVLRVKADGTLSYEPAVCFDGAKFVSVPIDLGPETDQVFLLLFGTGWRFRSALSAVTVTLGGVNAEVLYAGDPGEFTGQDQINLRLSRSLVGKGEIDLALTVDSRTANKVKINVSGHESVIHQHR